MLKVAKLLIVAKAKVLSEKKNVLKITKSCNKVASLTSLYLTCQDKNSSVLFTDILTCKFGDTTKIIRVNKSHQKKLCLVTSIQRLHCPLMSLVTFLVISGM